MRYSYCYYISVPHKAHFSKMSLKKCKNGEYDSGYLLISGEENAKDLYSELELVIKAHLHKGNAENGKRKLYHITMSTCSHFCGLMIKEEHEDPKVKNTYDFCLYFEKEGDAKKLLREIKQCILGFCTSRKLVGGKTCPKWVNGVWAESDNREEYVEKVKTDK